MNLSRLKQSYKTFYHYVGDILANRFIRNIGWLGLAEFGARLTRLITTILLARFLLPNDFGLAALALTTHELIRVLGEIGVGQAIVRSSDKNLAQTCNTAFVLNWICCLFLFFLQVLMGFILAHIFEQPLLRVLVLVLAIVYLVMPFGLVHVFLIKRKNNLGRLAAISGIQVGLDNILTAIFAVLGMGVWAIVLPKLLTAPVWLIGVRLGAKWHLKIQSGWEDWRKLISYGLPLLGSEILISSRMHFDKIIVGGLLGIDALGIYYFAFNAGLGFSLSLTKAFSNALYPHLCLAWRNQESLIKALGKSLVTGGLIVAVLLWLQAAFMPIYAPIIFGQRWVMAIPLMVLLCLTASPRILGDGASQTLRVIGRTDIDFIASILITFMMLSSLVIGIKMGGLLGGGIAFLITSCIAFPLYILFVIQILKHMGKKPLLKTGVEG